MPSSSKPVRTKAQLSHTPRLQLTQLISLLADRLRKLEQELQHPPIHPKTTLFVMSIYSQIMTSENSLTKLFAYGIYISGMHLLWFCLIALFCSSPVIRNKILAQQHNINRIIGIILGTLGLSLFLTNL